jgi:tetratricopeptide (TPR) repeat protein
MRVREGLSPEQLHKFRQEALAMLELGAHPFVVQAYELLELGRDTAIVMEYVPPVQGCTSAQHYIVRTQDYSDRTLGVWAVGLCVGMEHALANSIEAHRDIKPANLLVGSSIFLKIADFGLALAVSHVPELLAAHADEPTLFQRLRSIDGRSTCGTPGYIAPELLLGGKASPQSDMFSVGVTLWQLAARSMDLPFPVLFRGDVDALQEDILQEVHRGELRELDSPFFPVIRRCLAGRPGDRYTGFPALREAIKDVVKRAGLGAVDFIVKPGFRGELEDYVSRGCSFLALGRCNRALHILDRAIEQDPKYDRALEARGETLYQRGDSADAMRDFKAASALNPDRDAPIIGMAKALLSLGQIEQARQLLNRVLARHPRNLDALLGKAEAEARSDKRDVAKALIGEILRADPEHALAHESLGRVLWCEKDLRGTARSLVRSLDINPLNMRARLALAAVLTESGQVELATQHYLYAQALHQGDTEGLNLVAVDMAQHGHEEAAIRLFREIAAMEPDSLPVMLVNIGNALINLGDEAAAVGAFKDALMADAGYALAYRRLGDLEDSKESLDQAVAYYAKACVYEPENPLNHSLAGTAYLRCAQPKEAREFLAASVRLLPEQPQVLYNLAVAHLQCDEPEDALARLADAVRLDKGYFNGWFLKAQIETQMQMATEAAQTLRQAIAGSPGMAAEDTQKLQSFAHANGLRI